MNRLKDKVALITGSTSGIGRASAELFASEGASVIVTGRRESLGKEVVKGIKSSGGEASFFKCDLTIIDKVKGLIDFCRKTYGRINVLYNNAGVEFSREVTEASISEWDKIMNTNLRSVFLTMKYCLPQMRKGDSVINTASMAASYGLPLHSIYSASKGGIVALTINAAADYAHKGVRINCINPGPIWTDMVKKHVPKFVPKSLVKNYIKRLVPMKRFGEPIEVARTALFLASDEASFITGAVIPVDGGATSMACLSNLNYGSIIKK